MRRPPILSVPEHVHPLVRQMFAEMYAQQIGVAEMGKRTGINVNTFKDWRTRTQPRIADLDACFTALGFDLVVKERKE